ncbi:hypothetical protein FW778_02105 [Ginsengibacter hankyongi]|uniref:Uncharacterized protein n=1 Tax=Ginsengibacter hankyongi TaxID=2607284 RepID=A0A5J5ILA5_9BACT|nr:hypothetical protein [Ginsengibacter hankyongi]KAA9040857.1 hypothetical protein FW778_02105 [Ginsengibacter hankyongi]
MRRFEMKGATDFRGNLLIAEQELQVTSTHKRLLLHPGPGLPEQFPSPLGEGVGGEAFFRGYLFRSSNYGYGYTLLNPGSDRHY